MEIQTLTRDAEGKAVREVVEEELEDGRLAHAARPRHNDRLVPLALTDAHDLRCCCCSAPRPTKTLAHSNTVTADEILGGWKNAKK